jgi:hypothetical protein
LVESFRNGWWPPKYIILHDFRHDRGDDSMRCFEDIQEYFDFVRYYETPLKGWADLLRFESNELLLFQRIDSGPIPLLQLENIRKPTNE